MKNTLLAIQFFFCYVLNAATPSCDCWIQRDASWSIVPFDGTGGSGGPGVPPEYRNDDWCSPRIILPFPICFFGDTTTKIYISNNGILTLDSPLQAFSSLGLPNNFKIIAPFWADVDTRGHASGIVYYKIFPHFLAVQWDLVGYFSMHDDKRNSFQLIVSDETISPLKAGNNIGFCYKTMEWTTGDASSGVNGFDGSPAIVGISNPSKFVSAGLFTQPSDNYYGPYDQSAGVHFLDNRTIEFNSCLTSINYPPIITDQHLLCDTIRLCQNDTFIYNASVLPPEQNETVSTVINTHGMNGVTFSSTTGNFGTAGFTFIATTIGIQRIDITATDDNSIPASTTRSFLFLNQHCNPGINEISNATINISPNPFNEQLNYTFSEIENVKVIDVIGRNVLELKNTISGSIKTTDWKKGMYYMVISNERNRSVRKLVKE